MGAEFDGKKIVVVGRSAGMGRRAALDVIDRGASGMIIARSTDRVDDTVAEVADRRGQVWGIAAKLTDRSAVADVQRAPSERYGDVGTSGHRCDATLATFASLHPLGHVGDPTDVANAITFRLSEQSSWITGTILNADGGIMAGRN